MSPRWRQGGQPCTPMMASHRMRAGVEEAETELGLCRFPAGNFGSWAAAQQTHALLRGRWEPVVWSRRTQHQVTLHSLRDWMTFNSSTQGSDIFSFWTPGRNSLFGQKPFKMFLIIDNKHKVVRQKNANCAWRRQLLKGRNKIISVRGTAGVTWSLSRVKKQRPTCVGPGRKIKIW